MDDPADVPRFSQADMLPAAPAIAGFVDAIAMRDIAADGAFAHAGIDDLRVGRRDSQCAHRRRVEIAIADIAPIQAAIAGLPDSARASAEIEGLPVLWIARHRHHTPATMRSDATPFQLGKQFACQLFGHVSILCFRSQPRPCSCRDCDSFVPRTQGIGRGKPAIFMTVGATYKVVHRIAIRFAAGDLINRPYMRLFVGPKRSISGVSAHRP